MPRCGGFISRRNIENMNKLIFLILLILIPNSSLQAKENWQLLKSTHFFIYYQSAGENTANDLAQRAESCYTNITDELGFNRFNFWTWDNRARIYLFDNQADYQKDTGASGWSAGEAFVKNKVIKTFLTAPGFLENVLPHEMAHIIFREMVGFYNPAVPLWLEEGVATYHENKFPLLKYKLAVKIKEGNFISLNDLNRLRSLGQEEKTKVELFYAQSNSLVGYLIAEFGKDRFVFFCQSLRDNRDFSSALSKAYSISNLSGLETAWKEYILR